MGIQTLIGRTGLAAAAFLGATLALAPAHAQQAIKFSLDFKFEGPSAPFLVAIDKGYFKAEGLDVTIDSAAGSLERTSSATAGTGSPTDTPSGAMAPFRRSLIRSPMSCSKARLTIGVN